MHDHGRIKVVKIKRTFLLVRIPKTLFRAHCGDRVLNPVASCWRTFGVTPNVQHSLTKDDLLKHNVNLINRAVEWLAQAKCYVLRIKSIQPDGKTLRAEIETDNVVRIDIAVDGWRSQSVWVSGGTTTIPVNLPPDGTAKCLELRAYDGCEKDSQLLAACRVELAEFRMSEKAPKSAVTQTVRRRIQRRTVWGRRRASAKA
jgi:hypothetical protein